MVTKCMENPADAESTPKDGKPKFGKWANGSDATDLDLIEVKAKITRTYWDVHLAKPYATAANYCVRFDDCEMAHEWARGNGLRLDPIAITGPHHVEFTEGEGLEPSR